MRKLIKQITSAKAASGVILNSFIHHSPSTIHHSPFMFSFWQQDVFSQPADVVIAGGGFMGLWSAYELKTRYPKLAVTLLEKDSSPGGASVRNAGFACFGSPGELLADAAGMGEDSMWNIVEMRYQGMEKIRSVLSDAAIEYDACGGYECFTDSILFQQVEDKLPWLNRCMQRITGKANVFSVADERIAELGMKNFKHLIANQLEGGLHSGKAIQTLLQKLCGIGVTILYGANVSHWHNKGSHLEIAINGTHQATIFTDKFLIATNAMLPQLTRVLPVQPARGQVLITKPIRDLPMRGTFHYDEGYYYWRNAGNRILLGGARNQALEAETTTEMITSDTIQTALKSFLYHHIHLPAAEIEIDYSWAGIMGFTENKQPAIQKIQPGVWAAVACNGMGVALTPVLAEQVVTQMMG